MDRLAHYHAHQARLQQLGEHWHEKLWHGHGEWAGDRFLNIYHHPLKDTIEVRYEVPNQKPQLVFEIALDDFDINKLCSALAKADNRKTSVEAKVAEVDAHNEKVKEAADKAAAELRAAGDEKLQWAYRKDTGNHVAPLTAPDVSMLN